MIRIKTEGAHFSRAIKRIGIALTNIGRVNLRQAVLNHYTHVVESQDDMDLAYFLVTIRISGSYSDIATPFYVALCCGDYLDAVTRFTVARSLALHLVRNNRPGEAMDVVLGSPDKAARKRLAVCIAHQLWKSGYGGTAYALLERIVPKSREFILNLWKSGTVRAASSSLTFRQLACDI